jgi:hypothetical protein
VASRSQAVTYSLVLTDVASGWAEAAAMVVREQTLVTETVQAIRERLPFPMLGLDVDNDSAFINETMLAYCGCTSSNSLARAPIGKMIRHGSSKRTMLLSAR